jgi:hypothetical protein
MLTQALSMVQALLLAWLAWQGGDAGAPDRAGLRAGLHQRPRRAGPPGHRGAAGGRQGRPAQRHRPQLLHDARHPLRRPGAGRLGGGSGEALCFLFNAASYLAVLLALLAIRLPAGRRAAPPRRCRPCARACATPPGTDIRASLLLIASLSLLATPYTVLMPLFAKEIFGGDARLYGLLMGTAGCGALGGAVLLALRSDTAGLGALVGRMAPLVGWRWRCSPCRPACG